MMMSSGSKKSNKAGSKLGKFLKAPGKMLIKARDFYIRSINKLSDNVVFSSAVGVPMGSFNSMPRSYSTNSSISSRDEDFRELVRANSTKILGDNYKIDLEFQKIQTQSPKTGKKNNKKMPRSNSDVIGRIDEDEPCCDFEDEDLKKMKPARAVLYSRSKSYAVSRRPALGSAALINQHN